MSELMETAGADETVTEREELPALIMHRRVRWYHIVVLGMAVLTCAATVGFFTSQSSERDDASAHHRATEAAVTEQRGDTARAEHRLSTDRAQTKATLAEIDEVTTSVHELTDLTRQEVDTLAAFNQLAITSPDATDEINAQLARAGDLFEQMRAKALAIHEQAEQLERRTHEQFAAALRSMR